MKHNTYLFVLVKSDSTSFKVGRTDNLDETIDYYEDIFRFRKDRSFVFSGNYVQMKNLLSIFISLLHNYGLPTYLDNDYKDMFDIKGLPLLIAFSETLDIYRIKTKKLSLRKTLEACKPSRKILSRKNKVNLLFDFNLLEASALEKKYNLSLEKLELIYKEFFKEMYKPHKQKFKEYLKINKNTHMIKEELLKVF